MSQTEQPLSQPAHSLPWALVVEELAADTDDGLTSAEAKQRLEKYGQNDLGADGGVNVGKILIRQFANAMTLVLILGLAVSFAIRSWIEGGVIAAVIAINIIVGFTQEYKAEKTMDSLRSLSSPSASAVRDGQALTVPTVEIVPGDLVHLKTGDTIPADVRLIEAVNFETDEALLTGESLPVMKNSESTFDPPTGPGDRLNVAYSSSTVTKGRATGIVYATGQITEIGAIAAALRKKDSRFRPVKRKADGTAKPHRYLEAAILTATDAVGHFLGVNVGTPLQKKLSRLAVLLFFIAIVCAIIVTGANEFRNNQEVIVYAVATGLSMIPASLVVVLTITMAAGTKRMVERNVIVRNLKSLEALGGVTDICSDKTGTLTQGKMVAKKAWVPAVGTYTVGMTQEPFNPTVGNVTLTAKEPRNIPEDSDDSDNAVDNMAIQDNEALKEYLRVASLANLANVHRSPNGEWNAHGDPTEIAIQVFATRFQWNRRTSVAGDNPTWKMVAEFPFDSTIKKMSVLYKDLKSQKLHVFTKGAVERVISSCTSYVAANDEAATVDEAFREKILDNMESLAKLGLRVLALASREYNEPHEDGSEVKREAVEEELVFRGLVGLYDPPRAESAPSVRQCHEAGIDVHMLTGDHPGTARAIASQVGILPSNMAMVSKDVADAMVMTATQFDSLSDDQIDQLPVLPLVIARCAPQTKVRMIEALHRRQRFCAMTGDGVNDSPSLKRADIGIAMGTGSDVAKDASDIILTDDNFASILAAVEEGRRTFDNIQKFVLHLLAQNIAQALILLIGLVFKDSDRISVFPLSPIEVLWIIMITSGLPDMGLGFERAAPDILQRPPHNIKKGVFTNEVMVDMVFYGLWVAALCLAAFVLVLYGWGNDLIGFQCNESIGDGCDLIFRARATCFATMTWLSVFLAWEVVDFRRPITFWLPKVWGNKFLFCAIMAGFITIFPLLYIPVINDVVFKHIGISWEWGIVFVCAAVFFTGAEAWKFGKRIFFKRQQRTTGGRSGSVVEDIESRVFKRYVTESSMGANEEKA